MDCADKRALRLHKVTPEEQRQASERYLRRRQQVGCTGCTIAVLVSTSVTALAFLLAYQLFQWLR